MPGIQNYITLFYSSLVICGSPATRGSLYSVLGALTDPRATHTNTYHSVENKVPYVHDQKSHHLCLWNPVQASLILCLSKKPNSTGEGRHWQKQGLQGDILATLSPAPFFTALVSNSTQEAVSLRMLHSIFVIPVPLLTKEGTRPADGSFCQHGPGPCAYLVSIMHLIFWTLCCYLGQAGDKWQ